MTYNEGDVVVSIAAGPAKAWHAGKTGTVICVRGNCVTVEFQDHKGNGHKGPEYGPYAEDYSKRGCWNFSPTGFLGIENVKDIELAGGPW